MAILSTTEVKTYIQETSTTYDTLIGAFLPICLQDFFEYTNNYFDNNAVRIETSNVTASSSDRTLIITGTNFSTYSFQSGDEFRIRNSKRNDGFYTAATVSSATITVSSSSDYVATFTLRNEAEQEAFWTINKIDVPMSVKPLIASMVKFKIEHPSGTPQSESLGDYSVTYGGGEYPESITKAMNKYNMVKFI
jgi:hypothetical protein